MSKFTPPAEKPLLQRLRETAEAHAKFEQGGGTSELLNEAAEAIEALDAEARMLHWLIENEMAVVKVGDKFVVALAAEYDKCGGMADTWSEAIANVMGVSGLSCEKSA